LKIIITRAIEEVEERTIKKLRGTWWNVSISALKWMDIISNTYCKYRLVV
jgi:hypothetical protein